MKDLGYSMDTGVLPVGRLSHALRRDNRYFGGQRLSLLVICLENQGNDSSNEHAELENSFPCNIHTCHPPLVYDWGQRSITPEKIEGNRLPGRCWQHREQHITPFDRLQGKKRGVSCGNAVIRPARESVRQAEIYLSPDFRIISFRIIPKSNTTAANTPQVNIPVYQGADCIAYSPGCVL